MVHIRAGNWEKVGKLMVRSARIVAQVGAEFVICPDNTIHQAFDIAVSQSPIPWVHIAEVVVEEIRQRGFTHVGILGTKYLMTGPVYPDVLKKFGINYQIPEARQRERIDDIIFGELVNGVFREQTRLHFNEVIEELKQKGCDGVILGCTEIPLIVNRKDCPLPTLDSTRLLARAGLRKALV
jgi:aspartate racemase